MKKKQALAGAFGAFVLILAFWTCWGLFIGRVPEMFLPEPIMRLLGLRHLPSRLLTDPIGGAIIGAMVPPFLDSLRLIKRSGAAELYIILMTVAGLFGLAIGSMTDESVANQVISVIFLGFSGVGIILTMAMLPFESSSDFSGFFVFVTVLGVSVIAGTVVGVAVGAFMIIIVLAEMGLMMAFDVKPGTN